jgi:lipopolysaccharide transport system ATP-binding protein
MAYAIRARNVGKKYLIMHQQRERYQSLRDSLAAVFNKAVFNNVLGGMSGRHGVSRTGDNDREQFWALDGVDFEIAQGERVGIIGRNGAGKSTLLKVLSRITEPTTGSVAIRGRVASLLEVGTGFHPELSGRENIFLNGAILGMTKEEIKRKFDAIVAFSEIEKFLDTPVKRYSSGMYVRLAFAVAAHLEPEILIVDEVLAVGDSAFQKKCLGRMGEVSREGRTVIFVSHNMSAVRQLCDRAMVIDGGNKVFDAEVGAAISHYQNVLLADGDNGSRNPVAFAKSSAGLPVWIPSVCVRDVQGRYSLMVEYEDGFDASFEVRIEEASKDYYSALLLHDMYGNNVIFATDEDLAEPPIAGVATGAYRYDISVPGKLLKPGSYLITAMVGLKRKGKIDRRDAAIRVEVVDTRTRRGTRQLYRSTAVVAPEISWRLASLPETVGRVVEPILESNR